MWVAFTITISGRGQDPDECWQDAVEGFALDPGPTPDESEQNDLTEGETNAE